MKQLHKYLNLYKIHMLYILFGKNYKLFLNF